MMRRRFRRARMKWIYADNSQFGVNGLGLNAGAYYYGYNWILPPGRVKWLCNDGRKSGIMFGGAHLWMQFYWQNVGAAQGLSDALLYVAVVGEGQDGSTNAFQAHPFSPPNTPSTVATWNEWDDDGLNSFLWSHYIKGQAPPNSVVSTNSASTGAQGPEVVNQGGMINSADADHPGLVCRTFSVRAEWQPDVKIKTKRFIKPGQGLALVMMTPSSSTTQTIVLNWNARILGR